MSISPAEPDVPHARGDASSFFLASLLKTFTSSIRSLGATPPSAMKVSSTEPDAQVDAAAASEATAEISGQHCDINAARKRSRSPSLDRLAREGSCDSQTSTASAKRRRLEEEEKETKAKKMRSVERGCNQYERKLWSGLVQPGE